MSQITKRTTYLTMSVLLPATLCIAAMGKTIYVDDDAAGANDGTSWANAYVYLQDALADANTAEKPVEIRVSQGIYRPDQGANQTVGDREATFQLINDVTIIGGYAGIGEPDPNSKNIELYETILSGDIAGDDVISNEPPLDWKPNKRENSYQVLDASLTNETVLLDGFTITVGSAGDWSAESGGGMAITLGNLTIANCKFTNCSGLYGGAIYNEYSKLTIINCTFSNNLAYAGAGMYNFQSDLTITGCVFRGNVQTTEPWQYWIDIYWGPGGGGILNASSHPTLTDCTFIGNMAEQGGGLSNHNSNPVLVNCTFTGNSASCYMHRSFSYGGGIHNKSSNPILTNCTFSENKAEYSGGGMDNSWDSKPILTNCTFSGNFAGDRGGGMDNVESSLILTNCIFSGNSAGWSGGAIYDANSISNLTNCTLAKNIAPNGNALACDSHKQENLSFVEITNCILWDDDNGIWNNDGSTIDITYSNIKGGQGRIYDPCEAVVWGKGNIDVESLFADLGYWAHIDDVNIVVEPNDLNAVWVDGDYHLKSQYGRWDVNSGSWVMDEVTSPCIDAGDPNSPVGDEPEPNGGRINMGAYGGTTEASKSDYTWWFATTDGPVAAEGLGIILPHEHIFTDLRGPTSRTYGQADAADVVRVMAPLLEEARQKGVGLLIECSSIGVGRNVSVIAQVAEASGLPVVVPTGVYGRANFAPVEHRNMNEDELTELFINEIREGIDGTGIKAGFIKIATSNGPMTALEEKLLRAAGRAASETGAAIASHTPIGSNAARQADILESISPAIRLIWVHAQNESNRSLHRQLAARGVFIEFDFLGWNPGQDSRLITAVKELLAAGYGDRILLSHDAGWYQPGERNGGTQMSYTYLVETFIPKLRNSGVDDTAIRMITETNPIRAFGFKSNE